MNKKNSFPSGSKVVHFKHGEGTVIRTLGNGLVDVRFSNGSEYVSAQNLKSKFQQNKNRAQHKNKKRDSTVRSISAAEIAENNRKTAEKLRAKEERAKAQEIRKSIIKKLSSLFNTSYLDVDEYYHKTAKEYLSLEAFNQKKISFVQKWINDNSPSTVNGQASLKIDDEQALAIGSVNTHVQVIARAGSGKTATLVNRTYFLIKHCKVKASEILLLAFNRKAVQEVRERLVKLLNFDSELIIQKNIEEQKAQHNSHYEFNEEEATEKAVQFAIEKLQINIPQVYTFHALAHAIVHPSETLLFDNSETKVFELSRNFQRVIDEKLRDAKFRDEIREIMMAHFTEDWFSILQGGYDKSKEDMLKFRRSLRTQSLKGEYVKSYGEKLIADFLFEHDVAYKYERNHHWNGINYKPDFTIFFTKNSGVIIEYFGLKGQVDYDEMTAEKKVYWENNKNWELVDIYSSNVSKVSKAEFYERLKYELNRRGVVCNKLSDDEIWERIKDRAVDRYTQAAVGFVGRCRKQSLSADDLFNIIQKYQSVSQVEDLFLNAIHGLYQSYLSYLEEYNKEDFDGLLQKAIIEVENNKTVFKRKGSQGNLETLKYLCIDEYQDFAELFHQLISAIRKKSPNIKLFCVGDDWQAINGFAGSNLEFYQNFNKYISPAEILNISTNYRSCSNIVQIGNSLMKGRGKESIAAKSASGLVYLAPLQHFKPSNIEHRTHLGDTLTPAILRIIQGTINKGLDVVILSRTNNIKHYVNSKNSSLPCYLEYIQSFFPEDVRKSINISSAHKYKGLEKAVVIVVDFDGSNYPLIHPSWMFSRILGDSEEKIIQEDRRLLYVALTRAEQELYLIDDIKEPTQFKSEILKNYSIPLLEWDSLPPVIPKDRARGIVVQISNYGYAYESGTFAIKSILLNNKYQWLGNKVKIWEKAYRTEGFTFDLLRKEGWPSLAKNICVNFYDDIGNLIAEYTNTHGKWSCKLDNIEQYKQNCLDLSKALRH
ncbi:UvrD-helicase domain-containing protein [Thalassomonas sp. M1454]|uniref:UvrD-helicase domain-containing protein n=1 Tax=Thalassomonas sp. M1454 TaxID=2594477 RepID=UPI00118024DA|nr:UvrD-helicase domain-containing protein [Thalassomonas sp. M1454]TRX57169.1 AAA family ATPase [Thalassomonas sp. M1454]